MLGRGHERRRERARHALDQRLHNAVLPPVRVDEVHDLVEVLGEAEELVELLLGGEEDEPPGLLRRDLADGAVPLDVGEERELHVGREPGRLQHGRPAPADDRAQGDGVGDVPVDQEGDVVLGDEEVRVHDAGPRVDGLALALEKKALAGHQRAEETLPLGLLVRK